MTQPLTPRTSNNVEAMLTKFKALPQHQQSVLQTGAHYKIFKALSSIAELQETLGEDGLSIKINQFLELTKTTQAFQSSSEVSNAKAELEKESELKMNQTDSEEAPAQHKETNFFSRITGSVKKFLSRDEGSGQKNLSAPAQSILVEIAEIFKTFPEGSMNLCMRSNNEAYLRIAKILRRIATRNEVENIGQLNAPVFDTVFNEFSKESLLLTLKFVRERQEILNAKDNKIPRPRDEIFRELDAKIIGASCSNS